MENKVLAVVNNREIKQSDVELLYANLGPNAAQYKGEEGYKQLVEQLILEEMLYSEAKENKMDEAKEYQVALEQLKRSLLAQYLVSNLMSSIDVSEKEVEEYYNSNKNAFISGETVTASHILVETLEKANDILKEINDGLSFADAAQKYSSCPSKNSGGNLGKFGHHLIQLNEKNESKELTLEEVKNDITNKIKYNKQSSAYAQKQNELKEKYAVEYKF